MPPHAAFKCASMAQTFLAILLVLACTWAAPDLARLRDFRWLGALLAWWTRASGDAASARLPAALLPLLLFVL
jgi:hypothetical protein